MPDPYWTDGESVTLYLGDMREVLPALGIVADCIIADPPYDETSLAWDRWPDGWLDVAAKASRSMWCFGSLRMFLDRAGEFEPWHLSQDIIWEKPNGTGIAADRFRRVHEHALHWYRGPWRDVHHASPRSAHYGARNGGAHRQSQPEHVGTVGVQYWEDDGTRLARSVMRVANLHQQTPLHPTEKPIGILDPLITYACPPGGLVVDPFAGSGSTLDAARASGRRAIGVEMHEPYAEKAARRLSQMVLKAS